MVSETAGSGLNFIPKEAGAYRLEAWLDVDGEQRPWIYTSPIYFKTPDPAGAQRPPTDLAATVEVHKDISYVAGKEADADKHKLNIYVPKDKKNPPVLLFVHSGSLRSRDRSPY